MKKILLLILASCVLALGLGGNASASPIMGFEGCSLAPATAIGVGTVEAVTTLGGVTPYEGACMAAISPETGNIAGLALVFPDTLAPGDTITFFSRFLVGGLGSEADTFTFLFSGPGVTESIMLSLANGWTATNYTVPDYVIGTGDIPSPATGYFFASANGDPTSSGLVDAISVVENRVPEPGTSGLVALAALGCLWVTRRQQLRHRSRAH